MPYMTMLAWELRMPGGQCALTALSLGTTVYSAKLQGRFAPGLYMGVEQRVSAAHMRGAQSACWGEC